MIKISHQAGHKKIMKLAKLEVIIPVGKGRGVSYQLNWVDG